MNNFFKLISTNLIISSLLGLVNSLFGGNFLYVFLISILVQYILYSVVLMAIINYFKEKTKQVELNKLENLSTILECAYCGQKNVLTFIPEQNERTEFVCTKCNKENAVIINFTVARITEAVPINSLLTDEDKNRTQTTNI